MHKLPVDAYDRARSLFADGRATLGNSAHKFAGFKPSGDEAVETLPGKRVVDVTGDGKWIFMRLEPGYVFKFGDVGGRVLFHQAGARLPKKYQFFLEFDDGTAMTVSVALWALRRVVTRVFLMRKPRGTPVRCVAR